ncbi:MAG: hypothetical protein EPN14_09300 [Gallionella sp.]|nr:MAG: hypothetical protein EPN14_09300 [Gallionella sp.]
MGGIISCGGIIPCSGGMIFGIGVPNGGILKPILAPGAAIKGLLPALVAGLLGLPGKGEAPLSFAGFAFGLALAPDVAVAALAAGFFFWGWVAIGFAS